MLRAHAQQNAQWQSLCPKSLCIVYSRLFAKVIKSFESELLVRFACQPYSVCISCLDVPPAQLDFIEYGHFGVYLDVQTLCSQCQNKLLQT